MQNIFEMYVHTSPFRRDEKGNLVNEAGEPLERIEINTLPEDIAKAIQAADLTPRKIRDIEAGKNVSLRKHILVNAKGEICEPAPNPRYNERRVTVCALYDADTKETKVNYSICRNDDIVVSRYSKALGRKIAKARALNSTPVEDLKGAERNQIIGTLFDILNVLHDEEQYSWKKTDFSVDDILQK
jgi:hypothetical protein